MIELSLDKPDPRLGRRPQIDERNKDWPIRAMLQRAAYKTPKTKEWICRRVLDQGQLGSCVGNGWAHELIAKPYQIGGINEARAVAIYKKAQTDFDEWPGSAYEGTSTLAGAKATQVLYPGTMESYRHALTVQDVIATLGYFGCIVCGINWYSSFYTPDANGFVKISGNIAGGHCGLLRANDVSKQAVLFQNSWSINWGLKGCCWISWDDIARLIAEGGDMIVPVHRGWWKK